MQIIERKKLSTADGLWLAALGRDLSAERLKAIIDESKKIPKGAPMGAYMYMLVKANSRQVREVMRMYDTATIDDIFVELGAAARWEAKGEAIGEARGEARGEAIGEVRGEAKGEAKKAFAVAQKLKDMGDPVEKIALVTGLSPAEIANL